MSYWKEQKYILQLKAWKQEMISTLAFSITPRSIMKLI